MDDRKALNAIFYILRTGVPMEGITSQPRYPSTVHVRFQEWVQSGLFSRLWQVGIEDYAREVGIEGNWLSMKGALVKAPLGGKINRSESH